MHDAEPASLARSSQPLITSNLSKPENTLDQVKKSFPKLKPTDAALIATALVLSGRYALARYDEREFSWPGDYKDLTKALSSELHIIQQSVEGPARKSAKAIAEEEPVEVKVSLLPNIKAGESVLGDREDLKTLLSDIISKGVEYVYSPTDIGWQWALDRANWSTLSEGELTRRIKLKALFSENAVGVEMGATPTRKRASRAKVAEPEPEPEPEHVAEPTEAE